MAELVDAPGLGPGPFGGGGSSPLVRTREADLPAPRLVAAPDKFRGTASAAAVAAAVGRAARAVGWSVDEVPMADGGEGTLDAVGGTPRHTRVTGPLGRPVVAQWRMLGSGWPALSGLPGWPERAESPIAVIESAQAAGRALVPHPRGEDAIDATTRGVGELVVAAVAAGARTVVVGVGGSATTDGGRGAVEAIGSPGRLAGASLVAGVDVRTPFRQAAMVFGPQKGAGSLQVAELGERLAGLVDLYRRRWGVDVDTLAGAGAGGGLAGGLAAMGARLVPGYDLFAAVAGLDERLAGASLAVTGEGRVDATSFEGKVVGGVVRAATAADVPVLCVGGDVDRSFAAARCGPEIEMVSLVASVGRRRAREDTANAAAEQVVCRLARWRA